MRERETQAWEVCTTPRASSFCNLFNFVKPQSCLTLRPRAAVRSPGAGGAPGRVPAAPRGLRAPGGGSAGGAPGTGSKALTLLCAGGVVVLPPSISLGCLKSCFEARPGISQCLEEPQPQPAGLFGSGGAGTETVSALPPKSLRMPKHQPVNYGCDAEYLIDRRRQGKSTGFQQRD